MGVYLLPEDSPGGYTKVGIIFTSRKRRRAARIVFIAGCEEPQFDQP